MYTDNISIMTKWLTFIICFCIIFHLNAQSKNWVNGLNFSLNLQFGSNYYPPAYLFSINYALHHQPNRNVTIGSTISFTCYNNTLGTEVVNENVDGNFFERFVYDFSFSPLFAIGLGKDSLSKLHFTYLNAELESPIINSFQKSFAVSTTFLKNSRDRNQQIGTLSIKLNCFYLDYINDGSFIIKDLGIGDYFDRYWTGGARIGISIPRRKLGLDSLNFFDNYLYLQTNYRVYTGYDKEAYELSNSLLFENTINSNFKQVSLNDAELSFSFQPNDQFKFYYGKQGKDLIYFQNKIHYFGHMPLHYGILKTRDFYGIRYTIIN